MNSGRFGVIDLLRAPGAIRHLSGELTVGSVGLSSARLVDDGHLDYDVDLESRGSQLVLTGQVRGVWEGECRRCLEPTHGQIEVSLTEVFEPVGVEGETWPIEDNMIDLAPVFVEAVMLELPLAPLCRADCGGPAPDRYPAAVDDEDPAHRDAQAGHDPRWSGLEGVRIED